MKNLELMTKNSEKYPIAIMNNAKVCEIKGIFGKTFEKIRGSTSDDDSCTMVYVKAKNLDLKEIRKQISGPVFYYPVYSPDKETILKYNLN